VERPPERERCWCRTMRMEQIDAIDSLPPVRLVMLLNPPRHITRPRAVPKPIRTLGQRLTVYATICKCSHRFEISPQTDSHCELIECHPVRNTLWSNHRAPGMLPSLHISDGSSEKSRAAFSGLIDVTNTIQKALDRRVTDWCLENAKCEECNSCCHLRLLLVIRKRFRLVGIGREEASLRPNG